jgi:hypothetical protein
LRWIVPHGFCWPINVIQVFFVWSAIAGKPLARAMQSLQTAVLNPL